MIYRRMQMIVIALLLALVLAAPCTAAAPSLREENDVLFQQLQEVHGLNESQMQAVRRIFSASGYIGQGNPAVARHPATPQQCQGKTRKA